MSPRCAHEAARIRREQAFSQRKIPHSNPVIVGAKRHRRKNRIPEVALEASSKTPTRITLRNGPQVPLFKERQDAPAPQESREADWSGLNNQPSQTSAQTAMHYLARSSSRVLHSRLRLHRPAVAAVTREINIGILRESYDKWERRVALTPDHVAELTRAFKGGSQIIVQPSQR